MNSQPEVDLFFYFIKKYLVAKLFKTDFVWPFKIRNII